MHYVNIMEYLPFPLVVAAPCCMFHVFQFGAAFEAVFGPN